MSLFETDSFKGVRRRFPVAASGVGAAPSPIDSRRARSLQRQPILTDTPFAPMSASPELPGPKTTPSETAPPRATGEDLKRAILDEARRTLETQGYGALSTRRIAAAVGCTATSIYLYFKSKDALVHALIEEGFDEVNDRVLAAMDTPAPPLERFERGGRAFVQFGLERTSYYEIMFMLRPEQMERFPADAYRRARRSLEAFAEVLDTGPEEGLMRGSIVLASLHGLVSLLIAKRLDARLPEDALIERAVHVACSGALQPHRT